MVTWKKSPAGELYCEIGRAIGLVKEIDGGFTAEARVIRISKKVYATRVEAEMAAEALARKIG